MTIELFADHLHNLKDKRRVISSLKERLRQRWNVAVAETGHLDSWQRAEISLCTLANAQKPIAATFQQIERFIDENCEMRITAIHANYY